MNALTVHRNVHMPDNRSEFDVFDRYRCHGSCLRGLRKSQSGQYSDLRGRRRSQSGHNSRPRPQAGNK
jgi:hypothetical protein